MEKTKKPKRKKIPLIILVLILVSSSLFVYFDWFFMGANSFSIMSETSFENSYDSKNGYWWGFNQNKVASINDVVFTFTFDNSNLKNGNSSAANPYLCEFFIVINGVKEKIGEAPSNRPCNVLTDKVNNKVYYIVSEPVGNVPNDGGTDYTGNAKAVIYTYSYNETSNEVTFENYETVIPSDETDGAIIRMGTAISENGDLMISYGTYNGYIVVYVKEYGSTRWARYVYLASEDGHSMMYNYAVIVNPKEFYVLAVQDWSVNNETYYQYAKLYSYRSDVPFTYTDENPIPNTGGNPLYGMVAQSNGWSEEFVIDKRDSGVVNAVRTEEFVLIDGTLHIVVNDRTENKLIHYTYKYSELIKAKDNFSYQTKMVRIVEIEDKLYYVTYEVLIGKIKVIEIETGKQQFRKFVGFDVTLSGNIYVDRYSEENINILLIKKQGDARLFSLEK